MFAAQNWRKTGTLSPEDANEERKPKTPKKRTDKKTDEPVSDEASEGIGNVNVQANVQIVAESANSFVQTCLNSPIFFVLAQPVVVFLLYFVFKYLS